MTQVLSSSHLSHLACKNRQPTATHEPHPAAGSARIACARWVCSLLNVRGGWGNARSSYGALVGSGILRPCRPGCRCALGRPTGGGRPRPAAGARAVSNNFVFGTPQPLHISSPMAGYLVSTQPSNRSQKSFQDRFSQACPRAAGARPAARVKRLSVPGRGAVPGRSRTSVLLLVGVIFDRGKTTLETTTSALSVKYCMLQSCHVSRLGTYCTHVHVCFPASQSPRRSQRPDARAIQ